ncbi:MAG: outer rane receptor protein [Segetibacter sp.]|jgi:hemoglobin/transferrin/lactoferrin receptor protein|nr:outer rane receptor protein [Segetibacter sp.]
MSIMIRPRCLVAIGVLAFGTVNAQKPVKDTISANLEEVIVSVSRWEQKMNEIPNTIVRVDMKEARLQNPQTSADLLSMTGQVFVQKSQLGGGSPMIRGFSANRVLLVVDGVRMNNAIYRSGNLQNVISIDPLSVQNAEVIFGPGSIIYGSDAIGGVMDFHTFEPVFSTKDKLLIKANGLKRYSSANNEQTQHVDVNLGGKKWAFLGSATYSNFQDVRMGRNGGQDSYFRNHYVERINNRDSAVANPDPYVQKQSGYNQVNALAKIKFKPRENFDVVFATHYSGTGNIPRYDRLIEAAGSVPIYAEWYYGPQVWKMQQLQLLHHRTGSLFDEAKLVLAYQDYKESRHDRRLNNAKLRTQTEKVKVYSANLDLSRALSDKSELFYGVEYVFNKVGSAATRLNINNGSDERTSTRYPDKSSMTTVGFYGSYKNNLGKKLTLATGIRYSYASLTASFDTTFFKFPFTKTEIRGGAFTGNVGLVFRPHETWQVNANISTGYRVPNIDDVGKVFDSEPGNVVVPNTNLTPEYVYNVDLGISENIHNRFKFDITVFYTYLDNAIVRRPFTFNGRDSILYEGSVSKVQALQNVAHASVWGLQTGYEWFFAKNLSWKLRANWINGSETDDTKDEEVPLRHAPPFYGSSFIKYQNQKWMLEFDLLHNAEVSSKDLAPSEQAKPFIYASDPEGKPYSPSWYTLNVKGSYRLNTHCTINTGLENITNQRYRPYSSAIVAPGLNFIASVHVSL